MNAQNATTNGQHNYLAILDEAWQAHLAQRRPDAPTVVSLFAGCGGSSLGYSMAGYRESLAVEWDNHAVACFKLNFPGVPVFHGDIAELSGTEALRMAGLQPGELDVLDGSPPCQGFSTAGKRILADPRNGLFREYARLLEAFRPKAFIMENVSGMVKGKMKLVFAEIMRALKGCGYKMSARLMNAMYFHVPQSRWRTVFLGVRRDLPFRPTLPGPARVPFTCLDAISDLEDSAPEERGRHKSHIYEQWMTGYNPRRGRAGLRVVRPGAYVGSFNSCRIVSSEPCPTFVKSHNHWHYSRFRQLTAAECARLASFPCGFTWGEDFVARIGNCVPPLFMRALALHLWGLLFPAAMNGRGDGRDAGAGVTGDVGFPDPQREPSHVA